MMMQFFKNNKIKIIALILLLAVGFGGYQYYQSNKTPEKVEKTAAVERGDLISSISATGSLSAVDNVDINSKITGRIVEVYVKENQHVKAGQKLLRLDDKTLVATQKQAEAKLQNALATYNRYLTLLNKGAIARSAFDTAEADYIVAQASYDTATSNVNDTVITSPIDGYVIGEPTPVGQTVSSGISTPQVLMSVANLDKMQIETLVDESDIGQVKVGQKVAFTVDAYPDVTFSGSVRLVSRSAVKLSNVIYYTVYVDVDNKDGKLLPTMTARTEIITNQANDVLVVPITCLRSEGKKRYVQVYDEAAKTSRNVYVKVGLTSDEKAAVTGDLQVGDKLLVRSVRTNATTNKNTMSGPPRF
ncbi:MAG: efflux RND transporter periplasmic adaptor subunit [Acidaminococcaceae bacterium]